MREAPLRGAAPRPASRRAGPGGRRPRASPRAPAPAARGTPGSPDRRPQHQRVDEEADQPLDLRPVAAGDAVPTAVVLAAVAGQQGLEGGEQHHEQGRSLAPGQLAQRGPAAGRRHRRVRAAELCTGGRGRSVGSSRSGGSSGELAAPAVDAAPAPRRQPGALPGGEVGVLHRQLGQGRRLPRRRRQRRGRPARAQHAIDQPSPRVVHGQHQDDLRPPPGAGGGAERPAPGRTAGGRPGGGQPAGLRLPGVARPARKDRPPTGRERGRGRVHHLNGAVSGSALQPGAQDLVAPDDLAQGSLQGSQVQGHGTSAARRGHCRPPGPARAGRGSGAR